MTAEITGALEITGGLWDQMLLPLTPVCTGPNMWLRVVPRLEDVQSLGISSASKLNGNSGTSWPVTVNLQGL